MRQQTLDIVRQVVTVAGVIFQVVAAFLTASQMSQIANEFRSPILPSGWAFAIWTPIFLLAAIYGVWQALPANRANPLLRRVGWFIAAGYIGNGVWEILYPGRQFLLAQVVITAILAVLVLAFVGINRHADAQPLTSAERWLVAMPLGLYFGWLTAAAFVGMAATLVVYDIAVAGTSAVVVSLALLLMSGAVAVTSIWSARPNLREMWLPYAAAVVWALAGVAANQLGPSPVTGIAAIAIGVVVLVVVVGKLVGNGQRLPLGQPA